MLIQQCLLIAAPSQIKMKEKKITLIKYALTDFDDYKTLVNDDEVMKYISGKGLTENEAKTKFNSIINIGKMEETLGYFKVLNHENQLIGDCKLVRYKNGNSILEIGYLLKKEHWRKGFGTVICNKLLAMATNTHPELDIIGIIDPANQASKALLTKMGFEPYFMGIENKMPTEKLILKR